MDTRLVKYSFFLLIAFICIVITLFKFKSIEADITTTIERQNMQNSILEACYKYDIDPRIFSKALESLDER